MPDSNPTPEAHAAALHRMQAALDALEAANQAAAKAEEEFDAAVADVRVCSQRSV